MKGHVAQKCPLNNNLEFPSSVSFCKRCRNYGHNEKDCLLCPNEIIINNPSELPLCKFCGSSKHYLCLHNSDISVISDYDSDLIVLSEEEDEKGESVINFRKIIKSPQKIKISDYEYFQEGIKKDFSANKNSFDSLRNFFSNELKKINLQKKVCGIKIFDEIDNEQIKDTIFCCKCGQMHSYQDCYKIKHKRNKKKNKNKNKNKEIKQDFNDCYVNIRKFNVPTKNPLKFEPVKKQEYIIDHHHLRNDYYNEDDSSGESFKEMYNNKNNNNNNNKIINNNIDNNKNNEKKSE